MSDYTRPPDDFDWPATIFLYTVLIILGGGMCFCLKRANRLIPNRFSFPLSDRGQGQVRLAEDEERGLLDNYSDLEEENDAEEIPVYQHEEAVAEEIPTFQHETDVEQNAHHLHQADEREISIHRNEEDELEARLAEDDFGLLQASDDHPKFEISK